ncbi:roadblock/LC7 domain-containing protein [Streptomyces sp. NPDC053367]|uniref:roadblock/LC7 domain-containing protein n=1 Tax=Streptomyces sp. NPDC053367 TaxID=3365700 RepID=UPI0037D8640C
MAAQAGILDELLRLRARLPQLTGALAASVDGLVLAHDTPGVEPEGLAALTAAALGVALRTSDATGRGELRELLLRGRNGYVATYAAGPSAVLTLLAEDRINVGRLHLEGRRSGAHIAGLVAAAGPAAVPPVPQSAPRTPAPTPVKGTARLPTRPTAAGTAAPTGTPSAGTPSAGTPTATSPTEPTRMTEI